MARQIVKKDNGLYAVWSTVVGDFILDDATRQEVFVEHLERIKNQEIENLGILFDKIDKGEKPYYQFTMTYEEMLEQRDWNK